MPKLNITKHKGVPTRCELTSPTPIPMQMVARNCRQEFSIQNLREATPVGKEGLNKNHL
jgi:hypothetical protein